MKTSCRLTCILVIAVGGIRALAKTILLGGILANTTLWLTPSLGAAERSWTGLTDGLWSNPNNWIPVGTPQDGEDLFFGSILHQSMVNDLVNLRVRSVELREHNYTLSGNTLTVLERIEAPSVDDENYVVTINCGFILGDDVVIRVGAGDGLFIQNPNELHLRGPINLNGHNLQLDATAASLGVGGEVLSSIIFVSGPISGTGNVTASPRNDCSIVFDGSAGNTFTGTLRAISLGDDSDPPRIRFNKSAGVVVNDRLEVFGRLVLDRDNQIGDQATVALGAIANFGSTARDRSFLNFQGHSDTFANLVFTNRNLIADAAFLDTAGGTLTLLGDITTDTRDVTPILRGKIDLPAGNHRFNIGGELFYGLNIEATVSGNGGITKVGDAALILQGNNPFLGPVVVGDGVAEARHDGAFGRGSPLTLEGGGSIALDNVRIFSKTLLVRGTRRFTAHTTGSLLNGSGSLAGWMGRIQLDTNLVVISDDLCVMGGPIVGPGGFEFLGKQNHIFGSGSSSAPSTYTGTVRALCELLSVNEERAFRGPLIVGGGFSPLCEVRWGSSTLNLGVPDVTVHPNGLVNLNGRGDTFSRLTFHGGRVITGTGFVSVARIITNPTNVTATIEGALALASAPTPEFTVVDGPATPDLAIRAVITDGIGNTGLVKAGDGELLLSAANTYDGTTRIDAGVLHVQNASSLGSVGTGTIVRDGATLRVESVPALPEPLNIRGAGRGGTLGALEFLPATGTQGPIVLDGPATVRVDSSFAILSSTISGTGPFTKVGGGALQFGGSSANTFSGDTLVDAGELVLSKPAGVHAIPGHLVIGSGARGFLSPGATVRQFSSLTIGGSVTVNSGSLWDLRGNSESFSVPSLQGRPPLTLNGGGDVQTGAGTLFLPVGGDVVVDPGSLITAGSSLISGNLGLDPGPHRFIVQNGVTIIGFEFPELNVSAVIRQTSTAADIVKEGFGEMRLGTSNSFSGSVTANGGRVTAAHNFALGTTAAGSFVNNNASLALDGGITVGYEPLTLNTTNAAALISLGVVTNIWRGDITLQRTAGIGVPESGGVLRFESFFGCCPSFITGPGGVTKTGPGAVVIAGTIANNYAGPTTVNGGLLEASRTQGPALSSNVVVSGASSILRTGRSPAIKTLPTAATMTVQDGALWTMNPVNTENLRRLLGDGRLEIGTGGTLTISNDVSCEFSGALSGSGALNKRGLATLHLTGNSPGYTGRATVFDGTYKVDGNILNGPVTVKAGSILRGTGVVGDVTVENGGVVRVDSDGPGRLGGELLMNSANFQNGSVLGLAFYGPHPTGGNDRLFIDDAVTLTSPTLSAGFNYPPHEGDVITLINLNAAGAVNGAIGDFPQGAVRLIGGIPVVTSYVGGNGNDVTLTVTNLPLRGGGSQLVSGNDGSALVPGDCSQLRLVVTNRSASAITGLRGALRSLTPGVVVTRGESAFPNLAPNARGSNATPFQIRTEPSFPCGGGAQLELVLSGSNIPPIAILYTFVSSAGQALSFNGPGNYVAVPHTTALNAFPFTVTMWVKTSQSTGVAGLANKYPGSLNGWNLNLRNGHPRARYYRNNLIFVSAGSDGLDGGFIADGQWHHVAFTVSSSGGRLYVDGVLRDSRAWSSSNRDDPGPPTTTQEVRFGNDAGNGVALNGLLDEISIWRAALSQAQIQTNMHRGLTGAEANLLAYYRCNDDSGPIVADSAPLDGNNNGAWVGTPLFIVSDLAPFTTPGGPDCNSGRGACESCIVVSGQFDANGVESLRRLIATGLPSICDPAKPCPGSVELPNAPVRQVLHHFTNSTAAELCVTAELHFDCPSAGPGTVGVAAYLGEFLINQPCSNYLGDDGAAGSSYPPFSFRVPPRTNFLLVVTARTTNLVCDTYALELFGQPCPPPALGISREAMPNKVRLDWSTAYPDFTAQQANSVQGAFSKVTQPPAIVGGRYALTNITADSNQFYRLFKP